VPLELPWRERIILIPREGFCSQELLRHKRHKKHKRHKVT
jgi:hypothetical protein